MADILVPESFVKVAEQLVEILSTDPEFVSQFGGPQSSMNGDNVIWGVDFKKRKQSEYVASPCDCA